MAKGKTRGKYNIAKKNAITKSVIVCPDCNEPYIVYRSIKKNRSYQAGHIKDLWCFKCKEEKKFTQLPAEYAKYHY